MNEEFEKWFRAEVVAERMYPADEEGARAAWKESRKQAIEECAKVCDELSREASDNGYSLSETWAHVVRNIKNRDAYRGSHEEGTVVKHYNEPGPLPYAKAAYAIRGLQKE